MKKILILHNQYIERGGEDIAVEREINLLKEKYIVEEIIVNNKNTGFLNTITIFLTNSNYKINKIVEEKLDNFQPDFIYIHNLWFTISLGVFKLFFKRNIPIYLKIHNFRYFCTRSHMSKKHFLKNTFCQACGKSKINLGIYNKYFDSYLKSIFVNRFGKKYIKIISDKRIVKIVLTNFHKKFLIDLGLNDEKINVIPNYLDLKEINNSESKLDNLIYAGRISKEKGIEDLILAFKKSNLKTTTLNLIGDGPDLEKLKEDYSNSKIIFKGTLNNHDTLKHIKNAKAVITNTLMYEGQPTLLCEASALGTISIFPDNGGIAEFFNDDYPFKFNQLNKNDLLDKINLLENKELVKKENNKITKNLQKILDKDRVLENFKEIFND